ncbi:SDR family NAD(P)-dependent oxidoreductase [Paraburkholderia sp. RL17-347-BIC-D]|uniref:SDR family NAD(P)-dependent oxidoreductase n=1 Tax=Paraburkholderia sp. RL17-347-BIC-D TaxID=3031632 RepID=UPI0038B75378
MRFKGKVALVTAGSAGIGKATAEIMFREGASVVLVARDEQRLCSVAASLDSSGGRAMGIACNALDPKAVKEAVQETVARFGRIDILVNGVGGSTVVSKPLAKVEELAFEEWQKLVAFNMDATFLFCHEAVPHMKRQGGGKIVNISSIAWRGLAPSSVAYAAAKGGIVAFTKKLSFEVAEFGINVNTVAPSFTATERMQESWNSRGEEGRKAVVSAIPLGRIATPEDQARVICFLASSDSDFITGTTLDVTGGL